MFVLFCRFFSFSAFFFCVTLFENEAGEDEEKYMSLPLLSPHTTIRPQTDRGNRLTPMSDYFKYTAGKKKDPPRTFVKSAPTADVSKKADMFMLRPVAKPAPSMEVCQAARFTTRVKMKGSFSSKELLIDWLRTVLDFKLYPGLGWSERNKFFS